MNARVGDDEIRKYAPRRIREDAPNRQQSPDLSADQQQPEPTIERSFVRSRIPRFASTASDHRQTTIEAAPPLDFEAARRSRIGLLAMVVAVSALAALAVLLTIPLWKSTSSLFSSE